MRNVFEYEARTLPEVGPARLAPRAPVVAPSAAPPPLVRIVGRLTNDRATRLALSIEGQIVILAPGQSRLGYTLVSVDPDGTAELRNPQGASIFASPAQ